MSRSSLADVRLIPVFRWVVLVTQTASREDNEQQCRRAIAERKSQIPVQKAMVYYLGSSREQWPQDRVWERIHRCVRQNGDEHAAFRVVEDPRHDERHGGDPEDEKGHIENTGYGPLATEPNGHVPNSPKDPKDGTRRHRSVALLEVRQGEAAPTDLFEKWSADEQRRVDI